LIYTRLLGDTGAVLNGTAILRCSIGALTSIAASTISSRLCVKITRLPDGMHSKVLLLKMDDGDEDPQSQFQIPRVRW